MVRLAELTSPAVARLARDPKAVVLLPLGAIEQHGPHLPLLVDWRGAEELASCGFRRFVLTNYQADPDHLAAIAGARRALSRRRIQVLVAGCEPRPRPPTPMVNPRVRALMRSPRPEAEWHSGELETALMLSVDRRLVREGGARATSASSVRAARATSAGPRRRERRPAERSWR